ncbi:Heterogeneous nuclear ribonucleoprotein A1-like 2 [Intoshia linei]|uniref:Heterogeneous nuclear ribonucleoprotein A1-like 2 n=1 Tax=Intoshia linei TaxID=1819745 RepID=A0A177BBK4_9BILA|nr:Heterogeneous nuclear ribonucleoprotein A1-like 2 [Intoshia linei]
MSEFKTQNLEQLQKLFVHSFSAETTEDELKQFFSTYGEVEEFIIIRDKVTKKSKRFGFCKFATIEGIDNVQSQRPIKFQDIILDTRRAAPKGMEHDPMTKQKINRLYVSGIREEIESEDLKGYFSKHGTIVRVDIMVSQDTGKKRGFAFIEFEDFDTVDKMCLMKSHMIKNYRCDVKKAIPKESMINPSTPRNDYGNRSYNNHNTSRDRSFNNSTSYGNREQYPPRHPYGYNHTRTEYAAAPYEQTYAPDAYSNRYQPRGYPQYDADPNAGYEQYPPPGNAQNYRHNPYKRY